MIQLLSEKYSKSIAYVLILIFSLSLKQVYGISSSYKAGNLLARKSFYYPPHKTAADKDSVSLLKNKLSNAARKTTNALKSNDDVIVNATAEKPDIGGPSQPEMSSFKSVGTDNMVNLFTGDFSYNIPLMDVGGYPVNIFYDGGVTMEQEASWVGLGWNINPGTVNRNMRGVPDDFDGSDTLTQIQQMKPNKTWGASVGADLELVGIKSFEAFKGRVGASLGISVNNYLGPAIDLGIKGTTGIRIGEKTAAEKNATPPISAGLSANLSSRYGLTFSPNVSLSASAKRLDKGATFGIGLSTSYNSRSGIKALQLNEQVSFSRYSEEGSDKVLSSNGGSLASTTISFAKPSYIPSMRMPLTNSAFSGHFQLGTGIMGGYGSVEAEVFIQNSEVAASEVKQRKPLVGYLHYQEAVNNPNAVMDFSRFNDAEVTPNTPIISVPQYTYDVFSIQGEGTGGSIRAYRNDLGYVRDNKTTSRDKSISVGVDVGPIGHVGANFNSIQTPSVISGWESGNKLRSAIGFAAAGNGDENTYFRNPGETSVLAENQFDNIGGTDLVRFKLSGSNATPAIEPVLEQYSKVNRFIKNTAVSGAVADRKKRTQVTNFLTAEEASVIGLDRYIKSYRNTLDVSNNLQYDQIERVSDYRLSHHISQVNVTEANGKRYIYGIPVYNVIQKDFTFSVNATGNNDDQVAVSSTEPTTLNQQKGKDGYLQITETPAYAHSFLLSGLLSPDYVDVTGNGVTEDDMGAAVKFNYTRFSDHQWRTPLSSGIANFNAGNLTEKKDDKGIISYGKRESWYLHSIESKTMIALFTVEDRADGKGVMDSVGAINTNENSLKKLKKIDLYSKADLKKNGLANAKPIKTVWFAYSYSLCKGTPDNPSGNGKLTLDSIYFTFNGKARINKNKYVFSYGGDSTNQHYAFNASDRWGSFKFASLQPAGMKNADYPYVIQDKSKKAILDSSAASWSLNKILLPSGGQLEVQYESDDYAFIQNKRAADFMAISGLGSDSQTETDKLYSVDGNGDFKENDYVFIKVPAPCTTKAEIFEKYLQGQDQLAFKLTVKMPKGPEYITSYATIADYGVCSFDAGKIWIKVDRTDGLSPLSLTALEYLREQLPGQAFTGYDVSESTGLKQTADILMGMISSLKNAFKNPLTQLRGENKAQSIVLGKSFIRLNDPDGFKYGGGQRVKSVKLKDNWQAMTGQYTSEYGQQYDYTTTEIFKGAQRTISSGVASYEPSIGGEENPFQTIKQVSNKLPLGPASYGAVEMPVLDAFFPAPVVGYSKVTVRSLKKGVIDTTKISRSGIGKQVTEFYTAKDFPVYYNNTPLDAAADKQEHQSSFGAFFYKYAFDSRALSQGFVVETNDMHGKMKSQSSYAETDSASRINYTENFYRNTGSKGLEEKFDFVYNSEGGKIKQGNMGIDVELMTDTREFSVKTTSLEVQGQIDLFPVFLPFWLPFIWPVSGNSENTYRAVTTTKVVNYHSILDSVVVIDKGSQVSTKNLVYDAETGNVVVNRTNNEFNQPVYSVTYPAYWAYSGMGLAYKNIDAVFKGVNFLDGKIVSGNVPGSMLESGDELLITDPGTPPGDNCGSKLASPSIIRTLWAFDKNKNASSLTNTAPDFVFMDSVGKIYTRSNVGFRIVRSGKRNMLDASVAGVTIMSDPIITVGADRKLVVDSNSKVINATALEYKEKWQTDNDVFKKYSSVVDPNTCITTEVPDCNGYLEKSINPYTKGLIGNFRTNRSMVFYGSRKEINPLTATNLKQNGFLDVFKLYWDFNAFSNLVPDIANAKWVWNDQVTRINSKGLELETKNALNIYTAAQYGYNKTMPVAITNNSQYGEMMNVNFEDNNYNEALNVSVPNLCGQEFIELSNMANSRVVKTDTADFNAHTGEYVLAVDANTAASKALVLNQPLQEYTLLTGTNNRYNVVPGPLGGNFDYFSGSGLSFDNPNTTFSTGSQTGGVYYTVQPYRKNTSIANGSTNNYNYYITTKAYLEIKESRTYVFNARATSHMTSANGLYNPDFASISIVDSGNNYMNPISTTSISNDNNGRLKKYTYCLQKGVYKLNMTLVANYNYSCTSSFCQMGGSDQYYVIDDYSFIEDRWPVTLDDAVLMFKNYTTNISCTYTSPIAAAAEMMNPTFNIPVNKKMLFSAWVRDGGNEIINGASTSSEVSLQFTGGASQLTTLRPSGPVIEGWQRYEGVFTAPAGATQVTMSFVNNTAGSVYFDDIRIHPFNANMKSYVYDPVNLRLTAELDANNYATFYEYDEEGQLVRTKVETAEGVKTIKETRSFKQTSIKDIQ